MKRQLIGASIAMLVSITNVHADEKAELEKLLPMDLQQLLDMNVSISTQSQKKMSKAPSVVSLITADDIKATGATNVTDILQSVPGIYIRHNLLAYRPYISMRGTDSKQVLIMINGAPIKDLIFNSGPFWKGLPVSMIDRVEIIRGPGSALFGADASAGVINIITKTASQITESEAGVRAGSFDTQSAWLQHGYQSNGFDIALTAEMSHTDGHHPYFGRDAQSIRNDVSFAPGYAHLGWDNQDIRLSIGKDNWRLMADYMRHSNLETGLTGAAVLDPLTNAGDSQASLALLYKNEAFAPNWGVNAELRYRDAEYSSGNGYFERPPGYRSNVLNPATTYPNGEINQQRAAERRLNFEISGQYHGFVNHDVRLGSGHVWQDLYQIQHRVNYGSLIDGTVLGPGSPLTDISNRPDAFAPERVRRNSYLYLQDSWAFAPTWELTAGLRYDDFSDFGNTTNPRLALVWQATDRISTKLLYGSGFRAPNYTELYSQTTATMPNPGLAPEKSKTWDWVFNFVAARDLKFSLNVFHLALSDIIALVDVNPTTKQYQNGGSMVVRGVETEVQWQVTDNFGVWGNYTRRKQNYDISPSLYGIPKEEAYLRADWDFLPRWKWSMQANWTGHRELPASDSRARLGSHTLADMTMRYIQDKHWTFAASVRNLFNQKAYEYTSRTVLSNYLPLPERNFWAEVSYKF